MKVRFASQSPAPAHSARYATCPSDGQRPAPPRVRCRIRSTPCQVGVDPGDLADPLRQPRDGEERPREEEHRRDPEAEERVEALVGLHRAGEGGDRRREREPEQDRGREGEHGEPRVDGAEGRDHDEVGRRGDRHPGRGVELVAEDDVADAERRREHRVELARPADGGHHRVRRLERRDHHRGRGEHAGRDVVEVGDAEALAAVDDRPQPDAERAQVEHRVQDRRADAARARPAGRR